MSFFELQTEVSRVKKRLEKRTAKSGKSTAAPAPPPNGKTATNGQQTSAKSYGRSYSRPYRARAFDVPVNYRVPGIVDPIRQPTNMTCWATVTTMMIMWMRDQSMTIETAIGQCGQVYADKFRNNQGLLGTEKGPFLAAAGLIGEPPMSYSIEGWQQMLRTYGPLWVTTDEQPGAGFAIHARIMVGINGDGTAAGTTVQIVDPATGSEYNENFQTFLNKYEEEARDSTGPLRIQVVHWPPNARVSTQQSASRNSRAFNNPAVAGAILNVVSSVGGAVVSGAASQTQGDITWQLDRMDDVRCPRDLTTGERNTPMQNQSARVVGENSQFGFRLAAGFDVHWQWNGWCVGNIRIENVESSDQPGAGIHVTAHINPNEAVPPRTYRNKGVTGVVIHFQWQFRYTVENNEIARRRVIVYGDGSSDIGPIEWLQR